MEIKYEAVFGPQELFDGMPSWEMMCGLTKREIFAMTAMQGLLSNPSMMDAITNVSVDFIKDSAYLLADAMLDENPWVQSLNQPTAE